MDQTCLFSAYGEHIEFTSLRYNDFSKGLNQFMEDLEGWNQFSTKGFLIMQENLSLPPLKKKLLKRILQATSRDFGEVGRWTPLVIIAVNCDYLQGQPACFQIPGARE